jgi:hypothetical protein
MKQSRRSRTRNQRKRELFETVVMAAACLVLWAMVLSMMVNAWAEHPAEQFVSGYEYMEAIGGDIYGNPQN